MNSIESEFRLGALPRCHVPARIRDALDDAGWTFTLEVKRRSLLSSRYLLTIFYEEGQEESVQKALASIRDYVQRPTSL